MSVTELDAARERRALARALYEGQERPKPEWIEEKLLRPAQVAVLFQVSRRTISEWARAGRLDSIVTPGGHHRFRATHVRAVLESQQIHLTS